MGAVRQDLLSEVELMGLVHSLDFRPDRRRAVRVPVAALNSQGVLTGAADKTADLICRIVPGKWVARVCEPPSSC
jgi:hypothetical protein